MMDYTAVNASLCSWDTFTLPQPFGTTALSIEAHVVTNYSAVAPAAFRLSQPTVRVENATFCNVTVVYTHPGHQDFITVETWLPLQNYNGRLQAVGGAGWWAGRFALSYLGMAGAVNDGYATVTTDAGILETTDPDSWALLSPGNVNEFIFRDLGSASLEDMPLIAKSLMKDLYGEEPAYSYWNGCSQGGRQGLMAAQRYPDQYDGIMAGAPAVYWSKLEVSMIWPQIYMQLTNQFPHECELDALRTLAIDFCDEMDDVADRVISHTEDCLASFDPWAYVGMNLTCTDAGANGTVIMLSEAAAAVANATWRGPRTATGEQVWFGPEIGADLTGQASLLQQPSVANTVCDAGNGTCRGQVNDLTMWWYRNFAAKDPDFDYTKLTHEEFDWLSHVVADEFSSFIETDDPDLSVFKERGGKIITYHGLADAIIPVGGSRHYYNEVAKVLPDVPGFFRLFEIPGFDHCFGGVWGQPTSIFEQLRDWVENGTAPGSTPFRFISTDGTLYDRILCPYPQRAKYDPECGDSTSVDCWACAPFGGRALLP